MAQTDNHHMIIYAPEAIAKAGGATALSRRIREITPDHPITPGAISLWKRKPLGFVPFERVAAVAEALGVSRLTLLPPYLRDDPVVNHSSEVCDVRAA